MPFWRVQMRVGGPAADQTINSDDAHITGTGDLVFGRRRGNDSELVAAFGSGIWESVAYIAGLTEEEASTESE